MLDKFAQNTKQTKFLYIFWCFFLSIQYRKLKITFHCYNLQGYNKPHAYIATQGPLPHTFSDFWRMIWEQGSIVIIMITNLIERGRRKCDMYWPEEGSETYGCVTVKHINTFSRAHYTVRMFSLKSSKIKKVIDMVTLFF